ncbi:hypothetical protein GGF46_003854 [Coemansia sp. RSA 552]|nr:hypothetical protein GGF46_003854 [Coemansia sp. RSA 552]
MVSLHKEENFVVIELGSFMTKAMQDVSDVNKQPTVRIRTRAGILKQDEEAAQAESEPKKTPTTVAGADEGEQAVPESSAPSNGPEATNGDNTLAEGSTEPAGNHNAEANDKDSEQEFGGINYMFGNVLESAAEESIERTVDIFSDGFVNDWDALSALLRHIVTKELGIRISSNSSAFLFSVPVLWPKADLENLTRVAFEHLNAPTIMIMEQPQLAVFGNGAVTGVVVDIGHSVTTVAPVIDSCVQSSAVAQTPVAGAAVTEHLLELLQADPQTREQFDDHRVPLEFAAALKESGLCSIRLLADDDDDDADQGPDNERQPFEFGGKAFTVCKDALAKAPEILLKPTAASATPLASLIRQAVLACDTDKRASLWESIHVIGGASQFPKLQERLRFDLETAVLPASNIFALSQTRDIRFGSIPEYFVGWRNCDHWTAFLGACLVAKVALADSRHFVSRTEYNDNGPSIAHTKSF